MIDWLFRNRRTGRITVAQVPNPPLIVFLVAAGTRWLLSPSGALDTILAAAATGGLAVWAVLEIASGVNPWRRMLGGVVLTFQIAALLAR